MFETLLSIICSMKVALLTNPHQHYILSHISIFAKRLGKTGNLKVVLIHISLIFSEVQALYMFSDYLSRFCELSVHIFCTLWEVGRRLIIIFLLFYRISFLFVLLVFSLIFEQVRHANMPSKRYKGNTQ